LTIKIALPYEANRATAAKRRGDTMSISGVHDRDLAASAFGPVKLHRGGREMILSYGCLPTRARASLRRAGLLVGTVLCSKSLPGSGLLGGFDYLFLGAGKDKTHLFAQALRDCARSGWLRGSKPEPPARARAANRPLSEYELEIHAAR
jgi:hypothetical protein